MSLLPVPSDEPFIMAIIGRRGSGKGHLCLDMLKHFYKGMFDFIIWISPTFQLQAMTLNIEDNTGLVVFTEWRPEIIHSLWCYMALRNSGSREGRVEKEQCLLVLDDVGLQAKKGRLSDQLDNIAFTSRHYGVSVIEMTQRITNLSTSVRSQLDALIMFREENPNERLNLFKSFGFGENKKEFFGIIDGKTEEKYSVVGIRNEAGHFTFFDLNGETSTSGGVGTSDREPGSGHPNYRRVQGVPDRSRDQRPVQLYSAPSASRGASPAQTPTVRPGQPNRSHPYLPPPPQPGQRGPHRRP